MQWIIENEGITTPEIPPHFTLGTYKDIDLDELTMWVKEVAADFTPIDIRISHLGLFNTGALFLQPLESKDLRELHFRLHQRYDDQHAANGYYYSLYSGQWSPHVTLVLGGKETLLDALEVSYDAFKAFDAKIDRLAIYEFYPVKELLQIPL